MLRSLIWLAVLTILGPSLYADRIYVSGGDSNPNNGFVLQIDSLGSVSTYRSNVTGASGLAFGSDGDLYVANGYQSEIGKYPANGGSNVFVSTGLMSPGEIEFDADGTLWVVNGGNGTVSRVLTDGSVNTAAVIPGMLRGLTVDAAGNIFVSSYFDGNIYKIVPNDGVNTTITTFATGVPNPQSLAVDDAGNLYAADTEDGVISKITPEGVVSQFASGILNVRALDFGSDGILYATALANNGSVVKLLPDGTVVPFASNLGPVAYLAVVVPEPSSLALGSVGLVAAFWVARRRSRSV